MPYFPDSIMPPHTKDESKDVKGLPHVVSASDYNKHDEEIRAIEAFIGPISPSIPLPGFSCNGQVSGCSGVGPPCVTDSYTVAKALKSILDALESLSDSVHIHSGIVKAYPTSQLSKINFPSEWATTGLGTVLPANYDKIDRVRLTNSTSIPESGFITIINDIYPTDTAALIPNNDIDLKSMGLRYAKKNTPFSLNLPITLEGTATLIATELPDGLLISGSSITGTPTKDGGFSTKIKLINGSQTSSFTLDIVVLPSDWQNKIKFGSSDNPVVISSAFQRALTTVSTTSNAYYVTETDHGFTVGQSVTVSGMVPSQYNGTFLIGTVPTNKNFSSASLSSVVWTQVTKYGTVLPTASTVISGTKNSLLSVSFKNNMTYLDTLSVASLPPGLVICYDKIVGIPTTVGKTNNRSITKVDGFGSRGHATLSFDITAALPEAYTFIHPMPTITNIAPGSLNIDGTTITINGTNFTTTGNYHSQPLNDATVIFIGSFGEVPAKEVVVVNSTTITCKSPLLTGQNVDTHIIIKVVNSDGQEACYKGSIPITSGDVISGQSLVYIKNLADAGSSKEQIYGLGTNVEVLFYGGLDCNSSELLNVCRGVNGTTPTIHSIGNLVFKGILSLQVSPMAVCSNDSYNINGIDCSVRPNGQSYVNVLECIDGKYVDVTKNAYMAYQAILITQPIFARPLGLMHEENCVPEDTIVIQPIHPCGEISHDKPVITRPLSSDVVVNTTFVYFIAATNNPTSYDASGLPAGFTVNPISGMISGIFPTIGTKNIGLTASNDFGDGTATLVVEVHSPPPPPSRPPVITSLLTISTYRGQNISYAITATNTPTSFSASQPSPLTIDTVTGVISGIVETVGSFTFNITANNADGSDTKQVVMTVSTFPPSVQMLQRIYFDTYDFLGQNPAPTDYGYIHKDGVTSFSVNGPNGVVWTGNGVEKFIFKPYGQVVYRTDYGNSRSIPVDFGATNSFKGAILRVNILSASQFRVGGTDISVAKCGTFSNGFTPILVPRAAGEDHNMCIATVGDTYGSDLFNASEYSVGPIIHRDNTVYGPSDPVEYFGLAMRFLIIGNTATNLDCICIGGVGINPSDGQSYPYGYNPWLPTPIDNSATNNPTGANIFAPENSIYEPTQMTAYPPFTRKGDRIGSDFFIGIYAEIWSPVAGPRPS